MQNPANFGQKIVPNAVTIMRFKHFNNGNGVPPRNECFTSAVAHYRNKALKQKRHRNSHEMFQLFYFRFISVYFNYANAISGTWHWICRLV